MEKISAIDDSHLYSQSVKSQASHLMDTVKHWNTALSLDSKIAFLEEIHAKYRASYQEKRLQEARWCTILRKAQFLECFQASEYLHLKGDKFFRART